MTEEQAEIFSNLYEWSGTDWELTINQSVTEPTCPFARLYPEMYESTGEIKRIAGWVVHCNTVDECIERLAQIAKDAMCSKTEIELPHDSEFRHYVEQWRKGTKVYQDVFERYSK